MEDVKVIDGGNSAPAWPSQTVEAVPLEAGLIIFVMTFDAAPNVTVFFDPQDQEAHPELMELLDVYTGEHQENVDLISVEEELFEMVNNLTTELSNTDEAICHVKCAGLDVTVIHLYEA